MAAAAAFSWRSALPRPLSWLPRLHEIRRAVAGSRRSHFGREDLEHLFYLQPRAAQKLLELLPTVRVGTSLLAEREALADFLERIHESEDPAAAIAQQRAELTRRSPKKLRHLVRTDRSTATLASLPPGLTLEPGRLEVRFQTLEELAQTLFSVAQLLEFEGDAMADRYELRPEKVPTPEAGEVRRMFQELVQMEEGRKSCPIKAPESGSHII